MDGSRSSLFFEAVRIITEMRENTDGKYLRWAVFENVPAVLSSQHGQDFRRVLESLVRIKDPAADVPLPESGRWLHAGEILGDGYSLAWRVLDAAQGWGVAQRRKRIFAVLDLAGACAGPVLFESEGLSGFAPPCEEAREGYPGAAEGRADPAGPFCLNPQGSSGLDISRDKSGTLIAQSAGFCTEHSADSRGIGYADEESPTLRAGVVPGVAIEYNPSDARIKIKEDGLCQTLTARCGTGGNNVPLTLKLRQGCEGGGKGALVQTDQSATLSCHNDQTLFQPKAYGISSDQSHAMLSDNPHAGIYEADTSRTLDTSGGTPVCRQGGMAVVEPKAVAMNVGFFDTLEEASPTLLARDWKDPPVVQQEPEYLVRRLTPLECLRLQGYPDDWLTGLESECLSEEEISRWMDIFAVWNGTQGVKPKTRNQVIKWLSHPNTDAAEYKAIGNSVAVPCVHFVLAGIVWAAGKEKESETLLEMDEE